MFLIVLCSRERGESPSKSGVHSLRGKEQRREPQTPPLAHKSTPWCCSSHQGKADRLVVCTLYFFPNSFPFSSSFHLEDALTAIGDKVCLEVSNCLSVLGSSPFSTDKETVLKGQIQAVASLDDPIRRIMGKFGGSHAVKSSGRVLMGL
jgi:hypothetical protein